MAAIDGLLESVDRLWSRTAPARLDLHVIGASALLLQTDYDRATKDGDVLETAAIDAPTKAQLLKLAGPGTALALEHRVYLEPVAPGLPFLPQTPLWHALAALNARLEHFDVYVLDVVDVVVSKIFRFSANDRSDIDAMVERELVAHDRLLTRFHSAVDVMAHDSRSRLLTDCIDNLHTVERDAFGVDESPIPLPEWLEEP